MLKRTLYTLLAALMAVPAYAAPLNPDDWETIDNAAPPAECFTFSDGKLFATGNTSGKELYYKVTDETPLMKNGSGLSITLQFDSATFLADVDSAFHILFHNDNYDANGGGDNFYHYINVYNYENQLNLYDYVNLMDDYHHLEEGVITLTINHAVKNNHLCYTYTLNGIVSKEYTIDTKEVNPDLAWRPSFGLSLCETTVYTVTDVTFTTVPIPEPATATLSLLALAGLAVRRRRH